jgi:hypothetical protein
VPAANVPRAVATSTATVTFINHWMMEKMTILICLVKVVPAIMTHKVGFILIIISSPNFPNNQKPIQIAQSHY